MIDEVKNEIDEVKRIDSEYHYFNTICEDLAKEQIRENQEEQRGKLMGIAVSVKDCICVEGVESRAGSAILNGYKPVFDATVVEKVKNQGGIIVGKTAQDAFGFGSFSTNAGKGFKVPLNPFDKERACGGSSGGAAGFTQKASFPHIALSESTGGSIACPASFCGVIGLCPTYGRVSRYGLIDYGNSLDKIGPMAKSMKDIALMLEVIAGHDVRDSTSLEAEVPNYAEFVDKDINGMKVGIISEAFAEGIDNEVKEKVEAGIRKLEELGAKTEKVSLPLVKRYGVECYYLIAMCEASTNLARYCGMRYGAEDDVKGSFNEYFTKVRSKNFNDESKRRIMIGTFARMAGYRDAYYIKAMKVRTKIIEEYKWAFKKFDALVSPTMPIVAPRINDIEKLTPLQNYMMDIMTVGPNLAGLPHVSVPVGVNSEGMPVGLMLIGDHLKEEKIIQLGAKL